MTYYFVQATGMLYDQDGRFLAQGYSGLGSGKNNPAMQTVEGIGPIPRGTYAVGAPENARQLGPDALPLTPDPANEMFGRSGFFIHGDSIEHPGCASHGCVIVPPMQRGRIEAGDELMVVETYQELPGETQLEAVA